MKTKTKRQKQTILEIALCKMEKRIKDGFDSLTKHPFEAIQRAHDSASKSQYGYEGCRRGTGPSSVISFQCEIITSLENDRDSAMSWIAGIRSFQELIESGLMSVSDAIKTISAKEGDKSRLAAAKLMAEPGHIRLSRERNIEINDENRFLEESEIEFGMPKGTLGRTTKARSDNIIEHDEDGTIRF